VRGQLRIDGARFDHADPHPLGEQFLAERFGERGHAELREVVDAARRAGDAPGGRADGDEIRHPPRRVLGGAHQVRQGGVGDVEHAAHVDVHHLLPFADGGAEGRAEQHHPGVVDQGVEPAQFGDRSLDRRGRLRRAGHVSLENEGLTRVLADRLGQLLELVAAPRHQGDGRAFGGEPAGGRGPDAAARPGDQRNRLLQRHRHPAVLLLCHRAHQAAASVPSCPSGCVGFDSTISGISPRGEMSAKCPKYPHFMSKIEKILGVSVTIATD
jgi:hypothetical protein